MTNLGEFPEAKHERAERVGDPLAALHLADGLGALWTLHLVACAIDGERSQTLESTDPIFTSVGGEAESDGRGRDGGEALKRLRVERRRVANRRIRISRERMERTSEALRDW